MNNEKKALLELLLKKTKEGGWKWDGPPHYKWIYNNDCDLFYSYRERAYAVSKQEYEQAVREMKEKKTAKELLKPGMFLVGDDGDVGIYVGEGKVVFHDNWLNIDNLDDDLKRGNYFVVSVHRVVDNVKGLSILNQQWLEENATLIWQRESDEDKEKRMKKEALEAQMKTLQQEMDMLSQQISAL